jgi:hypothetical protein
MLTTLSVMTPRPTQRCFPKGPLYNKSNLRSTSELVDQLQEQLPSKRAQHRFNMAEKEKGASLGVTESAEVARTC